MSLPTLHLVLVSFWGGVVLAEFVIERAATIENAAKLHYWIDVLIEIPLLFGVAATGAVLAIRTWPPSPLLLVKMVSAVIAIGANLYCAAIVVARYRSIDRPEEMFRHHRRIQLTGLAVPFGLVALVIGLRYFS